jgi:hypothetical protein
LPRRYVNRATVGSDASWKYNSLTRDGVVRATLDGKGIVAKMKDMPTDDALFGRGMIRADGARSSPQSLTVERGRVGANPGGRLLIGTICARFRSNGAFIL